MGSRDMFISTTSIICNAVNVVLIGGAFFVSVRKMKSMMYALRYFTMLSNLYCAFASLALLICTLAGKIPGAVRMLKYSSTCAVAITFLTVVLFLCPVSGKWKELLSGYDFFLHLICPVIAIVSYCFFEKRPTAFYTVIYGTIPTAIYAVLYLFKVRLAAPEKRWEDFYGFNRGKLWPLSIITVVLGSFGISVLIRLV